MALGDMKSYGAVQKWMNEVNQYYRLRDEEWPPRLEILRQFCEHVGQDPDTIIRDAKVERTAKVDYMRRLRRYIPRLGLGEYAAHEHENVIRSFFIHNGARVIAKPYTDVYRRGTGGQGS